MIFLILLAVFIFASAALYWFAGITFNGLPVLMYHKVSDSSLPDYLTITTRQLERQFRFLVRKKFTPIFLKDLSDHIEGKKKLPAKPVLLTFDDGYKNNYTCLYPLLQRYGLKATIFLIAGFIQSPDNDEFSQNEFLTVDDIRMMQGDTVQFGLHSYDHKNYNDLTANQVAQDIQKCRSHLDQLSIPYQPSLAYTFGAYPKKDPVKRDELFKTLEANGIQFAFRIGNRLNKFPIKNRFLIQRIDIRGDESFAMFTFIVAAGKKILFK